MKIEIEEHDVQSTTVLNEIKDEKCEENLQDQSLQQFTDVLCKENLEENKTLLLGER